MGRQKFPAGMFHAVRAALPWGMTEDLQAFDRITHPTLDRIRKMYFWAHLFADFAAGLLFVAGSWLFFSESTVYTATWMFLVGSVFFAIQPTIRLVHEIHRRHILRQLADAVEEAVVPTGS